MRVRANPNRLLGALIAALCIGFANAHANPVGSELNNPFSHVDIEPFEHPSLRHLELEIPAASFEKLIEKRRFAIEEGILESAPDDFVPAKARLGDQSCKIKIRLKGDYAEHLKSNKWSFRIKTKGDNTLMGMKVFSLQHPRMRLYLHEWIVHKALAHEGLVALRYDFVKVSINGIYLGLFNLEEHFEKRLVENNARREGPLLKLDESELFKLINQDIYDGGKHDTKLFMSAEILPFQRTKTYSNPVQNKLFNKAAALLDAFRKGDIPASEVFDIEQFAKYYAITDVFMGKHGIRWHNQRFYFNPINSRIEPVGFDFNDDKPGLDPLKRINKGRGLFFGTNWTFDVFSRMLFGDTKFFISYMEHAQRIAQVRYVENLFRTLEPEAKVLEGILEEEFSNTPDERYIRFDDRFQDAYYENQSYVLDALTSRKQLLVYLKKVESDKMTVVYNNRSEHLLDVFAYEVDGQIYPIEDRPPIHTYRFYTPYIRTIHNLYTVEIHTNRDLKDKKVKLHYRSLGQSNSWQTELIRDRKIPGVPLRPSYPILSDDDKRHPMRAPSNWNEFPFLEKGERGIELQSGNWILEKNLILPADTTVTVKPGASIDLRNGASIISNSPFNCLGSKEKPIRFFSSDLSGGGIMVRKASDVSRWLHTQVDGLSNPGFEEWQLTGAVTFFKSPLSAVHCSFRNNRCEDGLNTVNTEVTLRDCFFANTASDAFDADFCVGRLFNNTFKRSGNDAVDVSGSRMNIDTLFVDKAGDKGVSAGERSTVEIRNLNVSGASIGMASKDASLLIADGATIRNSRIGICAYQKKPEYSPPEVEANEIDFRGVDIPVLREPSASVKIDDRLVVRGIGKKQSLIFDSLKNGQQLN